MPDGGCREIRFGDDEHAFSILVWRSGAEAHAWVNQCPHFSLPLNARPDTFLLLSGERVMCAYHCAVFRLRDGVCVEGPARGRGLDRVPIVLAAGELRVAEEGA